MALSITPVAPSPTEATAHEGVPARDHHEIWVSIVRHRWGSVVIVPAEKGVPAGKIATTVVEIATRVSTTPVQAIVAEPMDYAIVAQRVAACAALRGGPQRAAAGLAANGERVIVAVEPVIDEPLGVTVALAADAVIVTAEQGKTRLASIRRTIDLLGRERLAGCIIVR